MPDAKRGRAPRGRIPLTALIKAPFYPKANQDCLRAITRAERLHLHPTRLVFVGRGFGGTVVKKVLLDCRLATSESHHSIWRHCTGVIFLGVPHLQRQENLREVVKWYRIARVYAKFFLMTIHFSLGAVIDELETINQDFLRVLSEMPPTFCVVKNISKSGIRRKLIPDQANATFVSRNDNDSNFFVNSDEVAWSFSDSEDDLYRAIIARLRQWEDGPENVKKVKSQPTALATRHRLLSIDGGGVRGLCSLLILHSLMQQVKDLEVSQHPESKDWPRFPCPYFDLVGGTSTGG